MSKGRCAFYSINNLAQRWGVPPLWVRRHISARELAAVRLGSKLIRIPHEEVVRFEAERGPDGFGPLRRAPTCAAHARVVADLVVAGCSERGFADALRKAFGMRAMAWVRFRPDAYRLTPTTLDIYEVEVFNPCTPDRLENYERLAREVSAHEVVMRLIRLNGDGEKIP